MERTTGTTSRQTRAKRRRRRRAAGRWPVLRALALVAAFMLVAAACGDDDDSATSTGDESTTSTAADEPTADDEPAETDEPAAADEVVTIEFWAWSPNAQDIVDLFEAENPDIKVDLINNGSGGDQYEKLQVAFAAGSGAPDVAMVEFAQLPQYALTEDIIPLDDLGGSEVIGDFADSVANQVTINGSVYGMPLDSAPMALGYRADLLSEAGITELPDTWDQFADAAATFNTTFPDSFIVNSPISDGTFLQMLWQAGATPVQIDGTTVTIDFTSDAVTEVLTYWVDLAQAGVVGTLPSFSPEWNQAFAQGNLGGWLMAAWGPVIIGPAAEDTSGNWRVSRMPSQDGERASAEWGGSAYTVTAQSENPEAAAEFVIWVNHEREPYLLLNELTGSFPVLKEFADDADFLADPFEFFGDQDINTLFAEELRAVPRDWQWSPFQGTVGQVVSEQTLAAQDGSVSVDEALANIQAELVSYAQDQGFSIG